MKKIKSFKSFKNEKMRKNNFQIIKQRERNNFIMKKKKKTLIVSLREFSQFSEKLKVFCLNKIKKKVSIYGRFSVKIFWDRNFLKTCK